MPFTLTTFDDTATLLPDHSFPQEIFDAIIDHNRTHKPTLLTCSLVCKSWLPRCRSHLFSEMNLTPDLVKFLLSSPHTTGAIVPYIKDAVLGGAWSLAQREDYDRVILLLLNLDGVRGLTIETWSWDFIGPVSKSLILKGDGIIFQNVTRLHLQYFRFPSFSVLATAISSFPVLNDLTFDNVTWDVSHAIFDESIAAPRYLKKLYIRSSPVKAIIVWLFGDINTEIMNRRREVASQTLQTLILPELLPSDVYVVGHLLRIIGSSLYHLEVGFLVHNYDNPDMKNLPAEFNLSYNQSLRILKIHHLTLYQFPSHNPNVTADHGYSQDSPVFWLVPLLSEVSSPLTELSLSMWLSQESHLDLIDWPVLTHVLNQPSFEGLQSLQFRVLGLVEGRDDLKNWILPRLSMWKAAGDAIQVIFL